ncbi:type II toxin-antitoxin system VapC family toxin [bacterium]|nr:type II toxin-antitoxin system VapC family toxin [bacterium]
MLLWLLSDPDKLSRTAKQVLQRERLFVSIASLWEIAIKQSNGKLELPLTPQQLSNVCLSRDIQLKQILPNHLCQLRELPKIHSDPFDRLIICQAIADKISIVTHDTKIARYNIATVW